MYFSGIYGDDKFGYKLWNPKNIKLIRSKDVVFREDQTIEDFGKEEVPQIKSQKNFEKIKELSISTRSEEEVYDDTINFPPSDDEGEDEVADDISNEFVNDVDRNK